MRAKERGSRWRSRLGQGRVTATCYILVDGITGTYVPIALDAL